MSFQKHFDQIAEEERQLIVSEIDRMGGPQPEVANCPTASVVSKWSSQPAPGNWSMTGPFGPTANLNWKSDVARRFRKLEDLRSWMKDELLPDNPRIIKGTDDLAKYLDVSGTLGQINLAVDEFLDRLNKATGFRHDGLALIPGDVPSNPTVNQVLKAIVADYERREIEVIL